MRRTSEDIEEKLNKEVEYIQTHLLETNAKLEGACVLIRILIGVCALLVIFNN